MRFLIFPILLLPLTLGAPSEPCLEEKCKLPNCRCSSTRIPGNLHVKDVPQMVLLEYDDGVQISFDEYWKKTIYNRKNPNGCKISVTLFISHTNSDYSFIHQLYRRGYEIALHSISHLVDADYWKNASLDELVSEFIGERDILHKFALIPKEAIKGIRAIILQLSGDKSFEWMEKNNLEWDCTWPIRSFGDPPMWPYTLDYKSTQVCTLPPCPTESHPGKWEIPNTDWKNNDNTICSILDACHDIQNEDALLEFMKDNFHRHYYSNRAPFPVVVHAEWLKVKRRLNAYNRFLDYLQSLNDVYIVSASQMLQWVKNPTPLSKMKDFWKCWEIPADECQHPTTCKLKKLDTGEFKYLTSCVSECPASYPWLGNPLGEAKVKQ